MQYLHMENFIKNLDELSFIFIGLLLYNIFFKPKRRMNTGWFQCFECKIIYNLRNYHSPITLKEGQKVCDRCSSSSMSHQLKCK